MLGSPAASPGGAGGGGLPARSGRVRGERQPVGGGCRSPAESCWAPETVETAALEQPAGHAAGPRRCSSGGGPFSRPDRYRLLAWQHNWLTPCRGGPPTAPAPSSPRCTIVRRPIHTHGDGEPSSSGAGTGIGSPQTENGDWR